jgi:tetratricopeptide (TPR) repeat protein
MNGKMLLYGLFNFYCWFKHASKLVSSNAEDIKNSATLERKISYCHLQLKRYDEALDFCSKSELLDKKETVLCNFLYVLIKLNLDRNEEVMEHLSKIPVTERPDIYVKCSNYAFKVFNLSNNAS